MTSITTWNRPCRATLYPRGRIFARVEDKSCEVARQCDQLLLPALELLIPPMPSRRRLLLGAASLSIAPATGYAHNEAGRVLPPLPAPELTVTLHHGRKISLPKLLLRQTTALQLMFAGCSSTCPIQGALFGALEQRLAGAPRNIRLVSVTIDPQSDDPGIMLGWLKRYGAGPRWTGATPEVRELDRWFEFLRARSSGADRHTAQVYLFNARAELVLRSIDFPAPDVLAELLLTLNKIDRAA